MRQGSQVYPRRQLPQKLTAQGLLDFIEGGGFKKLLRSKGFLWLASDTDMAASN
ncbi:MAG: GTP-binding protein [Chloroflexi bacterium]|nr:GTP-binding protein [Chloroflexota bacterium]